MSLTKCPECDKDVSSKATSCPHCGFPLATTPEGTAQSEQPQLNAEAVPESAVVSPSPQSKRGGPKGLFFSVSFLVIGFIMVSIAIFGYTKTVSTGTTVTTRGWLRAAIEDKPEVEFKSTGSKEVPATSVDRWEMAQMGMGFVVVGVVYGLWILHTKYGGLEHFYKTYKTNYKAALNKKSQDNK